MDSKADQPLLEPTQRHPSYIHAETKEFYEKDPKTVEHIEHIELHDAETPLTTADGAQGETLQVTTTETTTDIRTGKTKNKTGKHAAQHTPLTIGLNVLDRDEKNINGQVHIMFDDVLAEPDGTHGFEPVWRGTFVMFHWTKLWMYRLLVAIFALPLAFVWGLLFALVIAINNYFCTPFFKLFSIVFFWIGRIWGTVFREVFYPVFDSFGRCFSGIRVAYGGNTKTFDGPFREAVNNVGTNTTCGKQPTTGPYGAGSNAPTWA
ncbi:uncharacterized protein LOC129601317 [Paramacrobiotus metropolitanus]|uniref:uncharacterized protein LOC129601317 n=1 Tax=Paramacrobiotus metropolitanus TaxID=2943436 RepID=UPI002445D82D|nr:uncharacterized protein LOC129601317 [Paramacrobiotus metropolitanus]